MKRHTGKTRRGAPYERHWIKLSPPIGRMKGLSQKLRTQAVNWRPARSRSKYTSQKLSFPEAAISLIGDNVYALDAFPGFWLRLAQSDKVPVLNAFFATALPSLFTRISFLKYEFMDNTIV